MAGFLSVYFGKVTIRKEAIKMGALSGAITGVITLLGQLIGAIIILYLASHNNLSSPLGQIPGPSSPLFEQVLYYGGGTVSGCCFGVIGIIIAGIAGGLIGAISVRKTTFDGSIENVN